MASVALAPAALADLERLSAFLAQAAPSEAERPVGAALEALRILRTHPRIGRPAEAGLRELVLSVGRSGYVALYRFDARRDAVLVLRLRHQREAGFTEPD